jgi:hypothetical protein
VRITEWHTQLSTTKWTYTATNKLLFEAGLMAGASPDTIKLDPEQVGTCPSRDRLRRAASRSPSRRRVTSSIARPPASTSTTGCPSQTFNGSMSYVTGSHNAKLGFELQRGHFWRGDNNESTGGIWYTTTAGCRRS